MTVGVPEIHLDTWGLKYVKKKAVLREKYSPALNINENPERARIGQGAHVKVDHHKPPETTNRGGSSSSTAGIDTATGSGTPNYPKHTGLPESKRPRGEVHGEFGSGKPSKNITTPNTISEADLKTPDAIETRQETADEGTRRTTGATEGSDKKRQQIGIKDTTIGTGKEVPVGSDTGIEINPRKKLTTQGKEQPKDSQNKRGTRSGAEATHESGVQSIETRTGKNIKGEKVDGYVEDKTRPSGFRVEGEKKTRIPKRGKPDTTQRSPKHDKPVPAGGGAPKIKAILDLAIIKCKLLKMKTKKHDFIEENKPTRPAYRKDDDDDDKKEDKEKSEHKCVSCGQKVPKEKKGVEEYSANEKHQIDNPASSYSHYKSNDEVVEKAIELINEAYDEMKSSSFKKLKPVYEGDTKEAKKEWDGKHRGGKDFDDDKDTQEELQDSKKEGGDGSATTSTVGAANFVYSDVEEKKKQ